MDALHDGSTQQTMSAGKSDELLRFEKKNSKSCVSCQFTWINGDQWGSMGINGPKDLVLFWRVHELEQILNMKSRKKHHV